MIKIEKNVNTALILPKMLIQIHVENALKHGLRTVKSGGKLEIKVANELENLKIEIIDNGIGRENSKKNNNGLPGIGLKTIQQIIELNNKKRKNKISQEIIDLKDGDGAPNGTKVIINIIAKI